MAPGTVSVLWPLADSEATIDGFRHAATGVAVVVVVVAAAVVVVVVAVLRSRRIGRSYFVISLVEQQYDSFSRRRRRSRSRSRRTRLGE